MGQDLGSIEKMPQEEKITKTKLVRKFTASEKALPFEENI